MPRARRKPRDTIRDAKQETLDEINAGNKEMGLATIIKEPEYNREVVIASDVPHYETVRFYNLRDHGKPLEFFYASKTHPLKKYTLQHDHEYTLPVEIVNHLEGQIESCPNSCHRPLYKNEMQADGKMSKSVISGYTAYFQLKRVARRQT